MPPSDVVSLMSGLLIGTAIGAALMVLTRRRIESPRRVHLTITDATSGRSAPLAARSLDQVTAPPAARGGPADVQLAGDSQAGALPTSRGRPSDRTTVRYGAAAGPIGVVRVAPGGATRPAGSATAASGWIPVAPSELLVAPGRSIPNGLVGARVPLDPWRAATTGSKGEVRTMPTLARMAAGSAITLAPAGDRPMLAGGGTRRNGTARTRALGGPGSSRGAHGTDAPGGSGDGVPVSRVATFASARGASGPADEPEGPGGLTGDASAVSGPEGSRDPDDAGTNTTDACADQRDAVADLCGLYERLRGVAEASALELRESQRSYDTHVAEGEKAAAIADPRQIRAAKDAAQATFRADRAAARTTADAERIATTWLQEINRINLAAREAAVRQGREAAAAQEMIARLERLAAEADAARIRAESALEACTSARQELADCQERVEAEARQATDQVDSTGTQAVVGAASGGSSGWSAAEPAGAAASPGAPGAGPGGPRDAEPDDARPLLNSGGPEPAMLRILRGDRAVFDQVVAALGGQDADARRHVQRSLGDLVGVIVAHAIDASYLVFPEEHPFWGPFTLSQNRAIAAALASLGYRFDGLGGFTDDRVPGYRDLSLAVGFAGLDPKRIRHWPSESEMRELFRDVEVDAGEYLAGAAGGLTLGEMIALLGRDAERMTDLWDNWGRLRPLLLAT